MHQCTHYIYVNVLYADGKIESNLNTVVASMDDTSLTRKKKRHNPKVRYFTEESSLKLNHLQFNVETDLYYENNAPEFLFETEIFDSFPSSGFVSKVSFDALIYRSVYVHNFYGFVKQLM